MPGCGMHSRPKLAEKARNNSLLKKVNNSGFYIQDFSLQLLAFQTAFIGWSVSVERTQNQRGDNVVMN